MSSPRRCGATSPSRRPTSRSQRCWVIPTCCSTRAACARWSPTTASHTSKRLADVVINARAAARGQLSGVERWAVELSARLPALRPGAYEVARPPRALAYRAGQAWEQVALPLRARARGARLVLNPANLAPLAWPRNVVVIHVAVVLPHPEWYSAAYAAWHGRVLPAVARRAARVGTGAAFSRDAPAAVAGGDAPVPPGGVDARFTPDADAGAARRALGLTGPYVLCVGGENPRKN